jgi:CheY-like chemotaxis protein
LDESPQLDEGRHVVLVVDDYEDVRLLYIEAFTEAGFTVDAAADGLEAVSAATLRVPHAILMDLQMPNMDGLEAARVIQASIRPTPYMIAVSAHGGDSKRQEQVRAAGFDESVSKPIAPSRLITMVRAALESRQPAAGG